MNSRPIPQSWEAKRLATPDHTPQFGIYADNEMNATAIVKGPHAEARARFIEAAPDLLGMLEQMIAGADEVKECWEDGNLAGAVTALCSIANEARRVAEKAKGQL